MPTFAEIPIDLLQLIGNHSSPTDFCNLCATCRRFWQYVKTRAVTQSTNIAEVIRPVLIDYSWSALGRLAKDHQERDKLAEAPRKNLATRIRPSAPGFRSGSWRARARDPAVVKRAIKLCAQACAVLAEEPNVAVLQPPGDIHGQYYDLLNLFAINGWPPETQYLFLGDYVDRGYFSVEVLMHLLSLKVAYPDRVTLLRGTHESRQLTQVYGFYDECMEIFGDACVWRACCAVFDLMPLAAVIDKSTFLVHGGISPDLASVNQISLIPRNQEIPHEGLMCELLWNNPEEGDFTWQCQRGSGFTFGSGATRPWLHSNGMDLMVCTALHQHGYEWMHDMQVLSIFSAPNYCYRNANEAAVALFGCAGSPLQVCQFHWDPAPDLSFFKQPKAPYFL